MALAWDGYIIVCECRSMNVRGLRKKRTYKNIRHQVFICKDCGRIIKIRR